MVEIVKSPNYEIKSSWNYFLCHNSFFKFFAKISICVIIKIFQHMIIFWCGRKLIFHTHVFQTCETQKIWIKLNGVQNVFCSRNLVLCPTEHTQSCRSDSECVFSVNYCREGHGLSASVSVVLCVCAHLCVFVCICLVVNSWMISWMVDKAQAV